MSFDYETAPRIACAKCGKKYIQTTKSTQTFVCYKCKKDTEHEKEKELILSPDCDEGYEPFSVDDGYFCPYCGEFIDIEDDYILYDEGEHDVDCPYCEKSFEVETYVSYSFTSRRTE